MQTDRLLTFGPYRLDPPTGQLWRGKQEVRLTGKASAVLRYLVERAGQVVTKEELFAAVWPETVVSDAALTSCIQELRQALRDNAKSPRYIETIYRRGFRFIAPLSTARPVQGSKFQVPGLRAGDESQRLGTLNLEHGTHLVGRETELAQLHHWLEKALHGARQLVFVTGEPGIGKTSVVEAFLQTLASRPKTLDARVWIGRGQCVEHYGAGEAYLPVLEAVGRLCREADGKAVIALLRQQAPSWLVQMPAVVSPAEVEELQRRTAGVTRERMLRELAEALEALTAERALILRLEDLHWSDYSTLDLLSVLARRQEAAQLLIVGTYRPVEVLTRDHPLKGVKHELHLHGQCEELALDFLTEEDVAKYLAVRFSVGARGQWKGQAEAAPLRSLARAIHQRTDGNPLFMVNVVNDLIAQGVLTKTNGEWELQREVRERTLGTPVNLRQLIEQQLERVSPEERQVLEAASVAGAEFSAAAVAAGAEQLPETVEAQCEALVRREQFLRARGMSEWLDGTVAARYQFLHALYQEVLYERIPAARCSRLHRLIGERTEVAYGTQAREIAAELAVHFEQGRDYRRAIQYLQQAGENAVRRSANQEAINLLTKGLGLLKTLPDTPERIQQDLTLQIALGSALRAIKGYAAPEVERAWTRAQELCQQVGETPHLYQVLFGLWQVSFVQAEFQTTRERAEQIFTLAQSGQDLALLLQAYRTLGTTLSMLGEFVPARGHLEQGLALYDSQKHSLLASLYSTTPIAVDCLSYIPWVLWFLGYPDQALKRSHEAVALAQELSYPFTLALALNGPPRLHLLRREGQAGQERAEAMIALTSEHGFPYWSVRGNMLRGWALIEQGQVEEGMAQIRQGLAAHRATGAEQGRPGYLVQLARAYGQMGQAEEGLAVLAEALATVNKTGERMYEAELYRIKGELALQSKTSPRQVEDRSKTGQNRSEAEKAAEECFWKAIEITQRQQAKSLELRAVMSLSRLWQKQGKKKQAHKLLAEIYGWFTEGFDTKDLQEAKALLAELSRHREI